MADPRDTQPFQLSRRTALGLGAGAALVVLNPFGIVSAWADTDKDLAEKARRRQKAIEAGWKTPNGWPAEKAADVGGSIVSRPVTGASFGVTLAVGLPYLVLGHVLARFSTEVRNLTTPDISGFHVVTTGRQRPEANHASGTAVDIMAAAYGAPAEDVFTRTELLVIDDILRECRGVVGWSRNTNASHFFIAARPESRGLRQVAEKVLSDLEVPASHARFHRGHG